MYVLVYKTGGLKVKLCIFFTVPVLNPHFTALAILIADKYALGTQNIRVGPKLRCEGGKSCQCQELTPLIRFATDSSGNILYETI